MFGNFHEHQYKSRDTQFVVGRKTRRITLFPSHIHLHVQSGLSSRGSQHVTTLACVQGQLMNRVSRSNTEIPLTDTLTSSQQLRHVPHNNSPGFVAQISWSPQVLDCQSELIHPVQSLESYLLFRGVFQMNLQP